MIILPKQVGKQVQEFISWIVYAELLKEQIQGGVARGLYPQSVADFVFRSIDARTAALGQQEID